MNENLELSEHIYKDASMAIYTLTELITDLKEKDNKIKGKIENILKEYETYEKKSKANLIEHQVKPEEESTITKMMSSMGIKKEVKSDNSDAAIADMLIKGISMGSIEMEKKVKAYQDKVAKEQLKLAKDFLKFQEETIEELKQYL